MKTKLSKLRADDCVEPAISRVYETAQIYRGPYLDAAPDLIAGFNEGYRASWDAAIGKITARVIEENPKAWCGDHGVDPALVPGVLLSSRRSTLKIPALRIAPTALQLFGVPPPAWMDGKPLFVTA